MPVRPAAVLVALLLSVASLAAAAAPPALAADADPVLMRFATLGDSREDPATPGLSPQDRLWLQNSRALARILDEIRAAQPQLLFFNGDMIRGYEVLDPQRPAVQLDTPDGLPTAWSGYAHLAMEYAYWRGMVGALLESGTYVVPVPGNHEMQNRPPGHGDEPTAPRQARLANEQLWRASMGDLILDRPRLARLGLPPLDWYSGDDARVTLADPALAEQWPTSQRQLSYSFDLAGQHFVVLNTDAVGHDGEAPLQWLAADLDAAERERHVAHSFVFGHKPAYTYRFAAAAREHGLSDLRPGGNRDRFWQLIEAHHASYFCGHEHIYHLEQPAQATGGSAWQVLVGSGGSPFAAANPAVPGPTAHPETDLSYAWALVDIHRSGRVELQTHGFDRDFGPSRLLDRVSLSPSAPSPPTPTSQEQP